MSDPQDDPVVVTGMGVVSPFGRGVEVFWRGCVEGRSAVRYITQFDATDFPVKIAAEVDFDDALLPRGTIFRRASRFCQFALAAALDALEDAAIGRDELGGSGTGVIVGNATGDMGQVLSEVRRFVEGGIELCDPLSTLRVLPYNATMFLSVALRLRGYTSTMVSACSAGTQAIGEAALAIQSGRADVMIAGGTEAWINPLPLGSFHLLRVLSTRCGPPTEACRPFDAARDGFVPGEGAAFVIMERQSRARARGARVYCEVAGYAATADAYHLVTPRRDGAEAARCILLALEDARVKAADVDYVSAHGTATRAGDAAETAAIKSALGGRARTVPVSATKSMIGHALGAGGALETVSAIKAIETGIVHPTINYSERDPACDLDYVAEGARAVRPNVVLKNSFALGGQNVALVLRAIDQ